MNAAKRQLTPTEAAALVKLTEAAQHSHLGNWTDPALLKRDAFICELMRDGVSPTAIARMVGVHRVHIYKIEKQFEHRSQTAT